MNWSKTLVIVGGVVAAVSNFYPANAMDMYLPLVGGVLAIIGGLMK